MMTNRGRPRKDDSKNCRVGIRLDEKHRDMLNFLIDKTGKSKTEIMTNGLRIYYNLEKSKY